MTTIIGGKLMQVDKSALKNFMEHTDTHNRIKEIDDMWKQHEKETNEAENDFREERSRNIARKLYKRTLHNDKSKKEDHKAQSNSSGFWTKKLMEYEEKDPMRWGHTGFKELYPEEFGVKSDAKEEENEDSAPPLFKSRVTRPDKSPEESAHPQRGQMRFINNRGSGRRGGRVERQPRQARSRSRNRDRNWNRARNQDKGRTDGRSRLPGRFDRKRSRSRHEADRSDDEEVRHRRDKSQDAERRHLEKADRKKVEKGSNTSKTNRNDESLARHKDSPERKRYQHNYRRDKSPDRRRNSSSESDDTSNKIKSSNSRFDKHIAMNDKPPTAREKSKINNDTISDISKQTKIVPDHFSSDDDNEEDSADNRKEIGGENSSMVDSFGRDITQRMAYSRHNRARPEEQETKVDKDKRSISENTDDEYTVVNLGTPNADNVDTGNAANANARMINQAIKADDKSTNQFPAEDLDGLDYTEVGTSKFGKTEDSEENDDANESSADKILPEMSSHQSIDILKKSNKLKTKRKKSKSKRPKKDKKRKHKKRRRSNDRSVDSNSEMKDQTVDKGGMGTDFNQINELMMEEAEHEGIDLAASLNLKGANKEDAKLDVGSISGDVHLKSSYVDDAIEEKQVESNLNSDFETNESKRNKEAEIRNRIKMKLIQREKELIAEYEMKLNQLYEEEKLQNTGRKNLSSDEDEQHKMKAGNSPRTDRNTRLERTGKCDPKDRSSRSPSRERASLERGRKRKSGYERKGGRKSDDSSRSRSREYKRHGDKDARKRGEDDDLVEKERNEHKREQELEKRSRKRRRHRSASTTSNTEESSSDDEVRRKHGKRHQRLEKVSSSKRSFRKSRKGSSSTESSEAESVSERRNKGRKHMPKAQGKLVDYDEQDEISGFVKGYKRETEKEIKTRSGKSRNNETEINSDEQDLAKGKDIIYNRAAKFRKNDSDSESEDNAKNKSGKSSKGFQRGLGDVERKFSKGRDDTGRSADYQGEEIEGSNRKSAMKKKNEYEDSTESSSDGTDEEVYKKKPSKKGKDKKAKRSKHHRHNSKSKSRSRKEKTEGKTASSKSSKSHKKKYREESSDSSDDENYHGKHKKRHNKQTAGIEGGHVLEPATRSIAASVLDSKWTANSSGTSGVDEISESKRFGKSGGIRRDDNAKRSELSLHGGANAAENQSKRRDARYSRKRGRSEGSGSSVSDSSRSPSRTGKSSHRDRSRDRKQKGDDYLESSNRKHYRGNKAGERKKSRHDSSVDSHEEAKHHRNRRSRDRSSSNESDRRSKERRRRRKSSTSSRSSWSSDLDDKSYQKRRIEKRRLSEKRHSTKRGKRGRSYSS